MPGAQQIEEVQPALGRPGAEPGEPVIADLRAKPVRGLMGLSVICVQKVPLKSLLGQR
jgi:hypothetical protein